jgi:hypothetical protein
MNPQPPDEPTPTTVDIVVAYLDDGSPRVFPVEACVRVGGTIVWRTVDDELRPFSVEKKPGPAGWEGDTDSAQQPGEKYAHGGGSSEGHQKLKVPAGTKEGRFGYSVHANGKVLDPDVVIKPR